MIKILIIYFTSISIKNSDDLSLVNMQITKLYGVLYFFYFKHFQLNYDISNSENLIIKKEMNLFSRY